MKIDVVTDFAVQLNIKRKTLNRNKVIIHTVSDWLVNIMKHLAAKETGYFSQELVETKNRAKRE